MKIRGIFLIVAFVFAGLTDVFGQTKSESFWVAGNCGMCEDRIEAAAKSVNGVHSAEWNEDNNMLTLSYDASKTEVSKVHASVAAVGHDTKLSNASDEVYKNLPACCQYERAKSPCSNTRKSGCCGRG